MFYALVKEKTGWVRMLISYETKTQAETKFILSGCKFIYGTDKERLNFKINKNKEIIDEKKNAILFSENDLFEAETDTIAEDIFIKELVNFIIESNKDREAEQKEFEKELATIDAKRKENMEKQSLKERWKAAANKEEVIKRKRGRPPKQKEN